MAMITFKIEGLDQLANMRKMLEPELFKRAERAGIAAAAKSVPKVAAKSIREHYNLPSGRVKQDISGPYIRGNQATLIFASRPPTLSQFGFKPGTRASGAPGLGRGLGWGEPTKPGKPGSAAIFKGQRVKYPTTFMGMSRGGVMLPFRVGKGYTSTGRRRLLVGYGPSVARIFDSGRFGPQIRAEVEAEISRRFIVGFQRVLDSAARGYGGKR
jgi:hypothetical protein